MTSYAVNGGHVVAVWETGDVDRFATVLNDATCDADTVEAFTAALQGLSWALWETFSCAAVDFDNPDVPSEVAARSQVLTAIGKPHRADDFGVLECADTELAEAAHRLGRVVRGDVALRAAALAEAAVELAAVERAECGAFEGRAAQAVALQASSVSPTQLIAAHELLKHRQFDDLYTKVEGPSACAAVVIWLRVAARFAADAAGADVEDICVLAADLDDVNVSVTADVLDDNGETDAAELVFEFLDPCGDGDVWFTPHDLLEQLISGLWACAVVAAEYGPHVDSDVDLLDELLSSVEDAAEVAFVASV